MNYMRRHAARLGAAAASVVAGLVLVAQADAAYGPPQTVFTGNALSVAFGADVNNPGPEVETYVGDGVGPFGSLDSTGAAVTELAADGSRTPAVAGAGAPEGVVYGVGDNQNLLVVADAASNRLIAISPVEGTFPIKMLPTVSPTGVGTDARGDLIIADRGAQDVLETTGDNSFSTIASGFDVYGVVGDASGDAYLTDPTDGRVVMATPDGVVTTIASGLDHPAGIAIDSSGNLFVTDAGAGGRVVEIPADASGSGFDSPRTVALGFDHPLGVAVDAAGDLLVADTGDQRLVKLASTPSGTHSSALTITCGKTAPAGTARTCKATAAGVGETTTKPGGTVTFGADGAGDLGNGHQSCTLVRGACSVTYRPTAGAPAPTVAALYNGDEVFTPAFGSVAVALTPSGANLSVSIGPASAGAGSTLTVPVTVADAGPKAVGKTTLKVFLDGLTATDLDGGKRSGQTIMWTIPSIDVSGQATRTLTVQAASGELEAIVSSASADPDASDNTATSAVGGPS